MMKIQRLVSCITLTLLVGYALTCSATVKFVPGTNATIDWIQSDTFAKNLFTNTKPILLYGYIAGEENFSFGFEWSIFTNKDVILKSKDFYCCKIDLQDGDTKNLLSASFKELSGLNRDFPDSTFVMLLTSQGGEVYILEKTMSPQEFNIHLEQTLIKDLKTPKKSH